MGWVRIGWPESQEIMSLCDEEGYDENVIATEESGCYLVNEDWLEEFE